MKVFTAAHPLGPWTQQGGETNDLACNPPQQVSSPLSYDNIEAHAGFIKPHTTRIQAAAAAAATATSAADFPAYFDTGIVGDGKVAAGTTIVVQSASFGDNCNASLAGKQTAAVAAYCNGKVDCGYQVRICLPQHAAVSRFGNTMSSVSFPICS